MVKVEFTRKTIKRIEKKLQYAKKLGRKLEGMGLRLMAAFKPVRRLASSLKLTFPNFKNSLGQQI